MITKTEGVLCLYNDKKELLAVVCKDEATRKNVFYACSEMGVEEIEQIFNTKEI